MNAGKNRKRDLTQIEEAYEAVVGNPPGKAAHKQQLKPGKPINRTYERAGKKVKVKVVTLTYLLKNRMVIKDLSMTTQDLTVQTILKAQN